MFKFMNTEMYKNITLLNTDIEEEKRGMNFISGFKHLRILKPIIDALNELEQQGSKVHIIKGYNFNEDYIEIIIETDNTKDDYFKLSFNFNMEVDLVDNKIKFKRQVIL